MRPVARGDVRTTFGRHTASASDNADSVPRGPVHRDYRRQPILITGSPGGDDQIHRTVQTLLNVIDFGMNVQQAIEAPRWSSRGFLSSVFPHKMGTGNDLSVESRISDAVRQALSAKGHQVRVASPWSLGSNAAIAIDPKTGVFSAAADPRVEAYAWAR